MEKERRIRPMRTARRRLQRKCNLRIVEIIERTRESTNQQNRNGIEAILHKEQPSFAMTFLSKMMFGIRIVAGLTVSIFSALFAVYLWHIAPNSPSKYFFTGLFALMSITEFIGIFVAIKNHKELHKALNPTSENHENN